MSIKERLSEGPMDRQRTIMSTHEKGYYDSYNQKVIEKGKSILADAGIPERLNELVELLKPDFPDAKIEEHKKMANGSIWLSIDWNFQDIKRGEDPSLGFYRYRYNSVGVYSYPLTEELVIEGREEAELLTKSQWSSGPKILDDAIARAFQNPDVRGGPPLRI